MDSILQQKAWDIIEQAYPAGEIAPLQFCVYREGECIIDISVGYRDAAKTQAVEKHTLFPIYSCSKTAPATALNRLIGQGVVSEFTPVREFWPEFAVNGKEETLLLHFLNHTSGLPQRFPEQQSYEFVADWDSMRRVIEQCKPDWIPGSQSRYQSLTYGWVTAEAIQRLTGRSFIDYVKDELFAPAGITDFIFGLTDEDEARTSDFRLGDQAKPTSGTTICDPLDELMRQPCIRRAVLPGFNGFASASGLAEFYNAILQGKYYPETMMDQATTMHLPEPFPIPGAHHYYGNGYQLFGKMEDGVGNVFGHDGYGGPEGFCDRKQQLAIGYTTGVLNYNPCRKALYDLAGVRRLLD